MPYPEAMDWDAFDRATGTRREPRGLDKDELALIAALGAVRAAMTGLRAAPFVGDSDHDDIQNMRDDLRADLDVCGDAAYELIQAIRALPAAELEREEDEARRTEI